MYLPKANYKFPVGILLPEGFLKGFLDFFFSWNEWVIGSRSSHEMAIQAKVN
jgi:hypothetical protein